MTRLSSFSISLTLILLAAAAPANGAMMTYDVTFSANTFQTIGDPVPVDPVVGEFIVTLDPAVHVVDDTADISLISLNITLDSVLSFTYNPDPELPNFPSGGTLRVGGLNAGADTVIFSPSTNDFWLHIDNFATAPVFQQVGYSQTSVSSANLFYTLNGTGSADVTQLSAVPEPGTLTLVGIGAFGLIAGAVRRRRKVAK